MAVDHAAAGRIEVMSLDDDEMRAWRGSVPGPVLVTVTPNRVRVRSGWRLPLGLAARLGPVSAARVLSALDATRRDGHPADEGSPTSDGRFTRRTVLGGLVATAGAVLGGSLIAGRAAGPAPLDARPVTADSPELVRLQNSTAVRAAGARFGVADWSGVIAARDPGDGSLHYFVPYTSPAHGTSHLSTTAGDADPALVIRPTSHGDDSGRIDFYDVRGMPIGALSIGGASANRTGSAVEAPDIYRGSVGGVRLAVATAPDPLDQAFFRCFGNCLQANGAQDAIDSCFSCVTGSYLYCIECTIRAGFQARACYSECNGPMYAG